MAKQEKKDKSAIKGTWEDVIKASVKGNPKPKKHKEDNTVNISDVLNQIETEVGKVAADCRKYLLYQVGGNQLHYSINYSCPPEKAQQIEKVMVEIAAKFGLEIKTGGMPD